MWVYFRLKLAMVSVRRDIEGFECDVFTTHVQREESASTSNIYWRRKNAVVLSAKI